MCRHAYAGITEMRMKNMPINVYEYGREGKCVCMFRHTYVGIREMRMMVEKKI